MAILLVCVHFGRRNSACCIYLIVICVWCMLVSSLKVLFACWRHLLHFIRFTFYSSVVYVLYFLQLFELLLLPKHFIRKLKYTKFVIAYDRLMFQQQIHLSLNALFLSWRLHNNLLHLICLFPPPFSRYFNLYFALRHQKLLAVNSELLISKGRIKLHLTVTIHQTVLRGVFEEVFAWLFVLASHRWPHIAL